MRSHLVHRSAALLAIAVATLVAACGGDVGSDKLDDTETGMSRDSVLAIIGRGAIGARGADTGRLVNGHHRQAYFIDGRTIELIWYRERAGGLSDTISTETHTPIILVGDSLAGWGWDYYLGEGLKLGIPDIRKPKVVAPAIIPGVVPPGADSLLKRDSTPQ